VLLIYKIIIITTGELNCCGGGWLSRGFCFWWQLILLCSILWYLNLFSYQISFILR